MIAEIARKIVVHGRVQGVGFRAFVAQEASARGLSGWVRNRRDGAVEAVFVGDATVVEGMIAACRRGPPGSRVDDILETDAGADDLALRPPGASFAVLRSI
jgi:acylphosphatase